MEGGEGNFGAETCNGESAFLADGSVADDSGNRVREVETVVK